MKPAYFQTDISRQIWDSKYRWRENGDVRDHDVADTWRRVAHALATPEHNPKAWETAFFNAMENFQFLPGGRILATAGTSHRATLFNCFVMGEIEDSIDGIFDSLKEGAVTMQQGGGVGYDFSTLRPKGLSAKATGRIASGPVSFMRIWNTMCATIMSQGARRGAMMATLRCDHPDIFDFVRAKQKPGELSHFNLSVLISDAFLEAVRADHEWQLWFADEQGKKNVLRTVSARELWTEIIASTYNNAEPGVLFIDRINRTNNLWYKEHITATNPCGEIPLPNYGACDLGSVNLTQFVTDPFLPSANFNFEDLKSKVPVYVRLLDNVIDASHFPLEKQADMARATRRIGLGFTGLADTLAMLNLPYQTAEARTFAERVAQTICHNAYRASIELAKEKGSFPLFLKEEYLKGPFIKSLPSDIQQGIARHGIRNSHLLAIAPTGTISLLANNVSSGIEPIFSKSYSRKILQTDGTFREYEVTDYAVALWRKSSSAEPTPPSLVTVNDLSPKDHLLMQAVLQPYIDNSISKTINVPVDFPFSDFRDVYEKAYDLGLKGCTTFRPNPTTGSVLGQA